MGCLSCKLGGIYHSYLNPEAHRSCPIPLFSSQNLVGYPSLVHFVSKKTCRLKVVSKTQGKKKIIARSKSINIQETNHPWPSRNAMSPYVQNLIRPCQDVVCPDAAWLLLWPCDLMNKYRRCMHVYKHLPNAQQT